MKLVTAVIKPHKWEDVREALETFGVTGMTVSEEGEVEGIDSDQHGESAYDLHAGLGGGANKSATSVLAKSTAAPTVENEGANA